MNMFLEHLSDVSKVGPATTYLMMPLEHNRICRRQ